MTTGSLKVPAWALAAVGAAVVVLRVGFLFGVFVTDRDTRLESTETSAEAAAVRLEAQDSVFRQMRADVRDVGRRLCRIERNMNLPRWETCP